MKIAYVIPIIGNDPIGPALSTFNLALGAKNYGDEVIIVGPVTSSKKYSNLLNSHNISYVDTIVEKANLKKLIDLRRILTDYDIIHSCLRSGDIAVYLCMAFLKYRHVITLRSLISTWNKDLLREPNFRDRVLEELWKYVLKRSKVIAISQMVKEDVKEDFECEVIFNSLEIRPIRVCDDNVLKTLVSIAMIGRLESIKNPLKAIDLINKLKLVHSFENIEMTYFGVGPMRQELEHKCAASKIVVNFPGYVENIQDNLQNIDIVFHARHDEAFGRMYIEGLMGGCRILAPNVDSAKEILSLFDEDVYRIYDQDDLPEKAMELIALGQIKTLEYEKILSTLKKHFSNEVIFGKYRKIYGKYAENK